MNDLKEREMVVTVVDIPEYCRKGKVGIVAEYSKSLSYPYGVLIEGKIFNFIRKEIEKVGGLIV